MIASIALLFALATAAPGPGEVAAEREIREVLAAQAAAWTRGDLDAFVAWYAEDASFLSPSGVVRGRTEVLRRYRSRYPDAAAMGSLELLVDRVVVLAHDERGRASAATVEASWRLTWPSDPAREPASGRTLLVLRRVASGWRIVQDASL